jgi:hypothetical protein
MSDEGKPSDQVPDQDARRPQPRRLADFYNEILNRAARAKTPEQEELEWQLAAKREDVGEPGWGASLKRGALFALPFLVGPLAFLLIARLFPHALRAINPRAAADLIAACLLLAPIAFTIGVATAE